MQIEKLDREMKNFEIAEDGEVQVAEFAEKSPLTLCVFNLSVLCD